MKHPFKDLPNHIAKCRKELAEMISNPKNFNSEHIRSMESTLGLYEHLARCSFLEDCETSGLKSVSGRRGKE